MGCGLLGLPIFTGCRGCQHFLGACVVATWVCRVYEGLSVSVGLVPILYVNALACQPVGNVEFAGVFLALSLSLAHVYICTSLCIYTHSVATT